MTYDLNPPSVSPAEIRIAFDKAHLVPVKEVELESRKADLDRLARDLFQRLLAAGGAICEQLEKGENGPLPLSQVICLTPRPSDITMIFLNLLIKKARSHFGNQVPNVFLELLNQFATHTKNSDDRCDFEITRNTLLEIYRKRDPSIELLHFTETDLNQLRRSFQLTRPDWLPDLIDARDRFVNAFWNNALSPSFDREVHAEVEMFLARFMSGKRDPRGREPLIEILKQKFPDTLYIDLRETATPHYVQNAAIGFINHLQKVKDAWQLRVYNALPPRYRSETLGTGINITTLRRFGINETCNLLLEVMAERETRVRTSTILLRNMVKDFFEKGFYFHVITTVSTNEEKRFLDSLAKELPLDLTGDTLPGETIREMGQKALKQALRLRIEGVKSRELS